jgi:hypothetical protein
METEIGAVRCPTPLVLRLPVLIKFLKLQVISQLCELCNRVPARQVGVSRIVCFLIGL